MFVSKVSWAEQRLIRPGSGWGIPEIRSELAEPVPGQTAALLQEPVCAGSLYKTPFPKGSQKR